ncbi:MAG TPA: DNA methyltransferase [Tepidisphaeraceae bacterium]|nr:DNA methyltransferase [Tepidisphaeraceae bacterium]
MNAVEIEEAVSKLAEAPFDPKAFPYEFLQAFGQNDAAIRKLKTGDANKSDLSGGVLQRSKNNIHILACPPGDVAAAMESLRNSAATKKYKARYLLATDGQSIQAERFDDGLPLACDYKELPDRFAYFLPLAGISTVKRIDENAFDIRATGRLNKLYVELLRINPDWDTEARRQDLNHFFARLIFCFFAEDTNIFREAQLFTSTVEQMTLRDGTNTHEVLAKLFEAMNTPLEARAQGRHLPASALKFPYVNGNLFAGSAGVPAGPPPERAGEDAGVPRGGNADVPLGNAGVPAGTTKRAGEDAGVPCRSADVHAVRNADVPVGPPAETADGDVGVPRFSQAARNYLLFIGNLDWKKINPDIFGSMIQAVADDEERGALGMHYTSVPNILKVLNPLFLDDLRARLAEAGDSPLKLLNLRKRLARIRVFDPACGSGNFLVIAYKEMRQIEAEINQRRGEAGRKSDIPISNFRGIEIRSFPAEIARLALIIAEFQCDVLYRGELFARRDFLPLDAANWITCGNALRLDWRSVCPPTGAGVKLSGDDLFSTPLDQAEIDFENEGGETYICGNPPYLGSRWRDAPQQQDLADLFSTRTSNFKDLDYVAAWYLKAAEYIRSVDDSSCAFVATKSICQGEQVAMLWPLIFADGLGIEFAHRPFHWSNLASHNAGVTVVIVGISRKNGKLKTIFDDSEMRGVANIGPYLIPTGDVIVEKLARPINGMPRMDYGNKPTDGGNLILNHEERGQILKSHPAAVAFIKDYIGSIEFINGTRRYCIWVEPDSLSRANIIPDFQRRFEAVRQLRQSSRGSQANANAATPHRFVFAPHRAGKALIVPRVSSERRPYLPAGLVDDHMVISDRGAVIYNPKLWVLAVIVSRMHLVWIANVCVRMRMDFSYSNTLGWNTFPVPTLTDQNKADLTRCAEDILLAREAHFPATIAEMYDPERMDKEFGDLRAAHERNDETLERIYIGRRFRNDTERLEKLFELYTQMTRNADVRVGPAPKRKKKPTGTRAFPGVGDAE